MEKPKLVDEFAALGLLRDDPPSPPLSPPTPTVVAAPPPRVISDERVRQMLRKAAASAGDCVRMLAEVGEHMEAVQEALLAVSEGVWVADDEPTVEIEAEEPPPPVPAPVALADTARLRPVEAVIATTGGEVARAPATEVGEPSWVTTPAPFGVAEGFGAAAVMVEESVPLPPEEPGEQKE